MKMTITTIDTLGPLWQCFFNFTGMKIRGHTCRQTVLGDDVKMVKCSYLLYRTVTVTAAKTTPSSSGNPSATTTTVQEIKYIKCKSCNNDIYFDEKQKSESGKFIPISRLTNQPHQCKYNSVSRKYHPAEWNGEREAEAVAEAVANKAKESKCK
jgi:hypothetical protein